MDNLFQAVMLIIYLDIMERWQRYVWVHEKIVLN
jgi:hypothetical protein